MKFNPDIHHRQSVRLKGYDYRQNGCYFVTICTHNRTKLFGELCVDTPSIENWKDTVYCALNPGGNIAKKYWYEIPQHYPYVQLDEFIIMPDHIHGIIIIDDLESNGAQNHEPKIESTPFIKFPFNHQSRQQNEFQKIIPGSLGSIIRGYKIAVTKWFRQHTDYHLVWQKNYYEHIIRDDVDLDKVREYIIHNPANWDENDKEML